MASPIPADVKNAVSFIFVADAKGELVPNGTAFFVMVKDAKIPEKGFGYLITAKHVIQDNSKNFFAFIHIRLNRRDGGADYLKIPLEGKEAFPIYLHTDPHVDLAVIPLVPSAETYDFKMVGEEMVTTAEKFKELNIREGDEIFFVGLFGQYFGAKRNYPISRFGRVALITDEKIPWREKGDATTRLLDLYLIEAQSFGGNSGSPVFYALGGAREPGKLILGGFQMLLAGVMQGTFLDAKEIGMAETRLVPYSLENMGIAAIVPAYKLHEILFSPELRAVRERTK